MRKSLIGGLALLTVATLLVPATALAADADINWHVGMTTRFDYADNFTDALDSSGGIGRDQFESVFYRASMGMSIEVDGITGYVETQSYGTWGDSLFNSNPQDPAIGNLWLTGIGGNNDMELYQAWFNMANIGGSMLSIKVGRQEKTLGNELHLGDNDFYSGMYYDGIDATLDFESWDLNVFWFLLNERDLFPGNLTSNPVADQTLLGGSDDQSLLGLTSNFMIGDGGDHIEPYILYSRQDDENNLYWPSFDAYMFGALYARPESHESAFDWSIEAAMQTGEATNIGLGSPCPITATGTDCDLNSSVIEGWFGYTFGDEDASHHRIAVGALILGEGSDSQDIETFIALHPDTHRRAGSLDLFSQISASVFSGDYFSSFANLTDINAGWTWTGEKNSLSVTGHQFSLTEDFGLPEDDMGTEIDLQWNLKHGEHFGVEVGVASFSPGDLFVVNDDTIMRAWAMGKFRM